MPHTIQRQDSAPKPVEIVSSTNALENSLTTGSPIKGTTKDPQDMMEDMLSFLDQLIQKETSNLRRGDNIQRCKEFVNEHGYLEEDYTIRVLQGVVKVLAQEERFALPLSPDRVDPFLLCAPE
ncbi:hypothetical protein Daus18300_012505 [Diaporthe australafricana]|uniref:Uncharacterized protein n=1 Tax=Diaporthe australafricana TaxID=127596 RepID=A0ABR3W2L9_9PEZI